MSPDNARAPAGIPQIPPRREEKRGPQELPCTKEAFADVQTPRLACLCGTAEQSRTEPQPRPNGEVIDHVT